MSGRSKGKNFLLSLEAAKRKQSEALAELERALLAELDPTAFFHLLVESASRLFEALTGVWLVAEEGVLVEHISSVPGTFPVGRVTLGEGMTGRCATERCGLLVRDYPSWADALPRYVVAGLRHAMAHPLLMGDQLLGVITMSRTGKDATPFTDDDLVKLEHLAGLAALALRNAKLYEEAKQLRHEAEALARVARTLTGIQEVHQVARHIVEGVLTVFPGCLAAGIATPQAGGSPVIIAAGGPLGHFFPPGQALLPGGLVDRASREQHPIWSVDMLAEQEPEDRRLAAWFREVAGAGVRAALAMPLSVRGRVVGVLGLVFGGRKSFLPEEESLGQAFADQAALALENARLYEEAERRRREAEELVRVARTMAAAADVSAVAAQIAESVMTLFGAGQAIVIRLDGSGSMTVLAVRGAVSGLLSVGQRIRPGSGLLERTIREGHVCWSPDVLNDPTINYSDERRRFVMEHGDKAALSVPLIVGQRAIGALQMGFKARAAVSEREATLAQTFADHAAITLDNASHYEEAQQRRHEAEVMAGIARTINASLDVDAILQQVVQGARELCESDLAHIALRDPQSGDLLVRYRVNTRYEGYEGTRLRPGTGTLGGLVLLTGRPARTNDRMADPRFPKDAGPVIQAEGIVSQMAVPIRIEDQVEGVLYVDNRTPRPFTDRDEAALVQLAEHAAIAIRNAQLYANAQTTSARLQTLSSRLLEVQEAERRHLARELHDEVGQSLTALKINLQMLKRAHEMAPSGGRLNDSLDMVNRILEGVRQMSLDLRPSLLDDLGLAAALRWYVAAQAERTGLAAEVVADSLPEDLSAAVATTCFRIVQEAVTNAVRHAQATRLTVTVACAEAELALSVRDDGVGFNVAAARQRALAGASMGILGLEERAELAGGRSSIESEPGQGTTVRAWLPRSGPSAPRTGGEDGGAQ